MKRGIIMEQHPDYTIIMTKDGGFHKAKRMTNREIGDEVYYEPYVEEKKLFYFIRKTPTKMLALACILLIVMLPVYFLIDKEHTFAYVNIDVNPSVEIEVDDHLKVYKLRPLNDDADMLVKGLTQLEEMSIEEAVKLIMETCEEKGLTNTEKNMLIGVSYDPDHNHREMAPVKDRINVLLNEQSDWQVTTYIVPTQVREIATRDSTSVNQVMADKIMAKDEVIVKEFELDNHEEDNKKEKITSFYSQRDKKKEWSPEQKKVNDQSQSQNEQSSNGSQDQKKADIHPSEKKKKVNHQPSDHPSRDMGPPDRSSHPNKTFNNKEDNLKSKKHPHKETKRVKEDERKRDKRERRENHTKNRIKQKIENRGQGHIKGNGNQFQHPHKQHKKNDKETKNNGKNEKQRNKQGNIQNNGKIEKRNKSDERQKSLDRSRRFHKE